MNIEQEDNGKKGRFYVILNSKQEAELIYNYINVITIRIDHTEVNQVFKGQGVGSKLIAKVVEFARLKELKIVPHCSYAKAVFEKKKEYSDLLVKN